MKRICLLFLLMISSFAFAQKGNWRIIKEELITDKPPFNQCHASTIVEAARGNFIIAFFAGAYEGAKDVGIWITSQTADGWSQPVVLSRDSLDSTLQPCWNPVLFKTKDQLFLFYKTGPNPREWRGVWRVSTDNGKTWSAEKELPQDILGPIKNKPVQLPDGTILSPSSVETTSTWKVHVERSGNGGKSWIKIPVDTGSAFKVIQPALLFYPGNRLQLLCRSDQNKIAQSWSADRGNTWSRLSLIDLPNPNSGIDAVTLKDGWQLLVYNPTVRGKDWSDGRNELAVAVSKNGTGWKRILTLENSSDKVEFSYPAVIQTADGKVHITYTYNRKNIKHVVLENEEM